MTPTARRRRSPPKAETSKPTDPATELRGRTDLDRDAIPMGSGELRHPPLGLGLWALGRWEHEDELRTRDAAERALERGLRWFDTAEVYGQGRSERILGEVLARARPPPVAFVSTKVSWEHLRPAQVRASAEGSFRRLGRPVDLYLVHAPDPRVPIGETMSALEGLQAEGRVRAIGVSNFSVEEMEEARAALRTGELAANQVRYNLFERDEGDPVLEYCRRNRIVLEAYTPLARGLLAGRFLDRRPPPRGDPRHGRGTFAVDAFADYVRRANSLADLAREAEVPLASLALHWLRARGAAPVFGARAPDQVDAIVEAWSRRPSDAVLARADRIARGE